MAATVMARAAQRKALYFFRFDFRIAVHLAFSAADRDRSNKGRCFGTKTYDDYTTFKRVFLSALLRIIEPFSRNQMPEMDSNSPPSFFATARLLP